MIKKHVQNTISWLFVFMVLTACQNESNKTNKLLIKSWQLNPDLSSLSFVTTKNKSITEQHSLKFKQGYLHEQRTFKAVIDLDSVDTLIPIRDERLRDILFKTEKFPTATVSTQLTGKLDLNDSQNLTLPFALNLHGIEKSLSAEVVVQMVNEKLVVTNYNPITVNAKDFALDDAINELTKIASLQGINYDVQVDFKLTFEIK